MAFHSASPMVRVISPTPSIRPVIRSPGTTAPAPPSCSGLSKYGPPEIAQARRLKARWLRERARQVPSYVSRNLYRVGADMIEQGTQDRFGIH